MAIILSTDVQDWKLDEDGNLVIDPVKGVTFVSGIDAVIQGVRIRLRLFLAEWFLNQDIGTPWYQELLGDNSKGRDRDQRFRAAIAFQILDTPGTISINSMALTFDAKARSMLIVWSAKTQFGDTPVDRLFLEF